MLPLAVLLVVLVGWAYRGSLGAPFVFDDELVVTENEALRSPWPPGALLASSHRPFTTLTLAANYAVGELEPRGYHAVNAAVHALAALALFGLVRRTLDRVRRERGAVGAAARPALVAFVCAAVWALHPLQTESVTYVTQRAESLMGLFYLLVLYCVARADESPRGGLWGAGAVAAFVLGAGSKEVVLTAPLVALLYDRAFLSGSVRAALRRRRWLYAALGAVLLAAFQLLVAGRLFASGTSAGFASGAASPLEYARSQPGVVLHYLALAIWPADLCLDPGWPRAEHARDFVPQGLAVGCLLAATAVGVARRSAAGFLGAAFFLVLAPTSSVLPIDDLAAEHRMYLPLASVVVAVGLVAARLLARPPVIVPRARRLAVASGVAVLLASLAAATADRNRDYADEVTLWSATAAAAPANPRAHFNLGISLYERGRYAEAVRSLGEAARLAPDDAASHHAHGLALAACGRRAEAHEQYVRAHAVDPRHAGAHNSLGSLFYRAGRYAEAATHYRLAVGIPPRRAHEHGNLGRAYLELGRYADALRQFLAVVELEPDAAYELDAAAKILARHPDRNVRDVHRAIELARRAVALTAGSEPRYLDTLAIALATIEHFGGAIDVAERALALFADPHGDPRARAIAGRLEVYRRLAAEHGPRFPRTGGLEIDPGGDDEGFHRARRAGAPARAGPADLGSGAPGAPRDAVAGRRGREHVRDRGQRGDPVPE